MARRCLDDRNRVVRVPSPLIGRARLERSERGQALLEVREGVYATPTGAWWRWTLAILAGVLVWVLLLAVEYLLNFRDAPIGRFMIRAPLSVFAVFTLLMTLPRPMARLSAFRDALNKARLCPVCGTDLDDQTAGEDRCVVCPRCWTATRLLPGEVAASGGVEAVAAVDR